MYDRPQVPELIAPTVGLHRAWLEARDEWGPGVHEDGFGLRAGDEVDSPEGFAAWVARLADASPAATRAGGQAGCTYRWVVQDGRVLGGIALRTGPADVVGRLGHVGYGIRPSERGRGLATWALGQILHEAASLGLARVLVVCAGDNAASARTIEDNGGVLEPVPVGETSKVRRYWITVHPPTPADVASPTSV